MPKGKGGAWKCDDCGKDADIHTTEDGTHKYFCFKDYEKYRPSPRGHVKKEGINDTTER